MSSSISVVGNVAGVKTGTSGKGTIFTNIRVASNSWRSDTPTWLSVIVFGKTAEYAAKLNKGDKVFVSGELVTETYTNKDGEEKSSLKVHAQILKSLVNREVKGGDTTDEWDENNPAF